jgi:copper chaperone
MKMNTITLSLKNIKCDGCVKSIKTAMEKHTNIKEVNVVKETGAVTIKGEDLINSNIIEELTALGYPENKKGLFAKMFS